MAKSELSRRIKQPLILKLFFVFLVTSILILSAVASYLAFFMARSDADHPPFFRRGLQQCSASLAAQIGSPPNYERALQLSTELGIAVTIATPNGKVWHSSFDNPTEKNPLTFKVKRDGTAYTFNLQPMAPNSGLIREIMLFIGALALILLSSFLFIRWLFRPLQWLMDGVRAISEGKLDHQVSLRPGDEFESLAIAFNQMTNKVNDMIRAREQLLSDLSHELRSPLTRMQLASEFIDKPELKESLKEDLREMESMVKEVLEAARLSSAHGGLNKAKLNVNTLLSDLANKYEHQSPGVILDSFLPEASAIIVGDEERLRSAFRNLIENALKYSSHQNLPVEIRLILENDGIEIEVRDHGIGIPEQEQTLVFEPFYRVDKSRTRATGGFGLGLNLCRKIVDAHGGKISLKSSLGRGTIFNVWLPFDNSITPEMS